MENDHIAGLQKEIEDFRDKIDIVQMEKSRLDMIIFHNNKVDSFSKKFGDSESKLDKFLPKLKEIQKQEPDALMEEFKHINVMDDDDAFELIEKLNRRGEHLIEPDYETEVQKLRDEIVERTYTAARHGLNYGKLYHGLDGGYSMEKLKTVMKRIKNDITNNLHPFIDPEQDGKIENQLRKILKLRIDEKNTGEAAQEGEGEEEEK